MYRTNDVVSHRTSDVIEQVVKRTVMRQNKMALEQNDHRTRTDFAAPEYKPCMLS